MLFNTISPRLEVHLTETKEFFGTSTTSYIFRQTTESFLLEIRKLLELASQAAAQIFSIGMERFFAAEDFQPVLCITFPSLNTKCQAITAKDLTSNTNTTIRLAQGLLCHSMLTLRIVVGLGTFTIKALRVFDRLKKYGQSLGYLACRLWAVFMFFGSFICTVLASAMRMIVKVAATLFSVRQAVRFAENGEPYASYFATTWASEYTQTIPLPINWNSSVGFGQISAPREDRDKGTTCLAITPAYKINIREGREECERRLKKESDADTTVVEHSISLEGFDDIECGEYKKNSEEEEALLGIACLRSDFCSTCDIEGVGDETEYAKDDNSIKTIVKEVDYITKDICRIIKSLTVLHDLNNLDVNVISIDTEAEVVEVSHTYDVGMEQEEKKFDLVRSIPELLAEAMTDELDLSLGFPVAVALASFPPHTQSPLSSIAEQEHPLRPLSRSHTLPAHFALHRVQGKKPRRWFLL